MIYSAEFMNNNNKKFEKIHEELLELNNKITVSYNKVSKSNIHDFKEDIKKNWRRL